MELILKEIGESIKNSAINNKRYTTKNSKIEWISSAKTKSNFTQQFFHLQKELNHKNFQNAEFMILFSYEYYCRR